MPEACARLHDAGRGEAASDGSNPSGRVNPNAVEAMKNPGYDPTTHTSKGLAEFNRQHVDGAVTVDCGDESSLVRTGERVDWKIPDP